MILSNEYVNFILDMFRGLSVPPITDFYVGLIKTDNTEVSGASYARVHIDASTNAWVGTHGSVGGPSSGTSKTITNATNITWGTALETWGSVNRVRFYTNPNTSAYFCDHEIATTIVSSGDTVEITAGDFSISTSLPS